MDQLITREIINLSWAVAYYATVIILGIRLLYEMRHAGWYSYLGNQVICALLAIFGGSAIYRTWIFFVLEAFDIDPMFVTEAQTNYWIAFVAAIMALCGLLCLIRILTREQIGHWLWISVGLLACATGFLVYSVKV
jgi:hypothetical protein